MWFWLMKPNIAGSFAKPCPTARNIVLCHTVHLLALLKYLEENQVSAGPGIVRWCTGDIEENLLKSQGNLLDH